MRIIAASRNAGALLNQPCVTRLREGDNNASCDRQALFRQVKKDKSRLADEITEAVMSTLKYSEELVSVGIEDVKPEHWAERVCQPDILDKSETIYKMPGYDPL